MSSRSHRHYAILRARCLEPGNRHENADVGLIAIDQIQPGFRIAEDAGSEAVRPAATLPPCRGEESAAIKSLRPLRLDHSTIAITRLVQPRLRGMQENAVERVDAALQEALDKHRKKLGSKRIANSYFRLGPPA
jgi:hypothetical protein